MFASTLRRSFMSSWLKFSDPEIRSVSEPSTTPSRAVYPKDIR